MLNIYYNYSGCNGDVIGGDGDVEKDKDSLLEVSTYRELLNEI